jgi:hypothetical protein
MKNKKARKEDCVCTYEGCPRHGDCEACKAYHHANGEKTACERKQAT